MKLLLLYLSNDMYAYIWNRLTIDTLIGDIKGYMNGDLEYKFEILQNTNMIEPIITLIKEYQPDLIAISLPIDTLKIFDKFITEYSKIQDEINSLLVLGNILSQSNIDYFLDNSYMKDMDYVIGLGHGEFVLRQLVEVIRSETTLKDVKNIIYWDSISKKLIKNPYFKFDLSQLVYPPTTDTIRSNRVNMIQTSRGCYFNCSYCSQGPGNVWKRLPLNRIYENIDNMIDLGINRFEFADEDFFGGRLKKNLHDTEQIIDFLLDISKKRDISYRIFTNPSVIFQEKEKNSTYSNKDMERLLSKMKKSGLSRIFMGIESGSLTQRKRYNRYETLHEISSSLSILRKLDIEADAGFIMFDPLVTIDEIKENIKFIKSVDLVDAYSWPISKVTLTKNSPYTNKLLKEYDLIQNYNYDLNSYDYKFNDIKIEMIYFIIHTVARQTGELFYIIKFQIKKYFVNDEKNNIQCAQILSKENISIYLNLLEGLIENDKICLNDLLSDTCKKLKDLMDIIKYNIDSLEISKELFDTSSNNLHNFESALLLDNIQSLKDLYEFCIIQPSNKQCAAY